MDCTLTTQSNQTQVFDNPEFGKIRTLMINDEPWFVAKDVAVILEYTNPQKAVRVHVDDEDKGLTEMDTPGGRQTVTIINESGLYSLTFSSKMENAKKFKRWVTSEVLPSIRKNGGYIQGQESPEFTEEELMAKAVLTAQNVLANREKRIKALEAEKKKLELENNHKKEIIEGLVEDISLSEKRSRISKIIRYRSSSDKIAMRWNVLYEEFGNKYHKNVRLGFERHKNDWKPKLTSVVDYVDRELHMIPELYELACKLFESDFKKMIQEWADIILTSDDNILEESF